MINFEREGGLEIFDLKQRCHQLLIQTKQRVDGDCQSLMEGGFRSWSNRHYFQLYSEFRKAQFRHDYYAKDHAPNSVIG